MIGRLAKRVALLAFCGVGLSLASCSSTGFAGAMYTSPDSDGKRTQTVFFSDYAESPAIYVVIPIVSGRNDETLTVAVKLFDVLGASEEATQSTFPNPIIISQQAPGLQSKPDNITVQFPDPQTIEYPNPADPETPLTAQPPRAVGHFEFIATMNGESESVKFQVNNPTPQYQGLPTTPTTPPAGTCVEGPSGNVTLCPQPTAADAANHKVACCTALNICGTGVEDTGLCN